MKQLNLQKLQNNLRKKFLKAGVRMIGPETIFFSKDTKMTDWLYKKTGKPIFNGDGSFAFIRKEQRKLKVKCLTKALVDEAFPGLIVKAVRKTTTQKKEK